MKFPRHFAIHTPILLLAALAAGCGARNETAPPVAASLPTAPVKTLVVQKQPTPTSEDVVATVRPKLRATLEAKLNGRVEQLTVNLGSVVTNGQLLARLNAPEISARLEQAEAALEQAERDAKRTSTLFAQQGATRVELDNAQTRLRAARAAVAEAGAMNAYAEITAPFDGIVVRKWLDVGDLAQPGKPIIELEDPAALQLEADIPEALAAAVKPDASLGLQLDGQTNRLSGIVRQISPAADPATRTVRVKLDLPAAASLKSGQFARLEVPTGERDCLTVPASAVVQRGQLDLLFVVEDGKARMHLVKLGKRTGGDREILSGLDAGSTVVIDGAGMLTDGQPVEVK
jgi:RND family efflux transporter MFP subunit